MVFTQPLFFIALVSLAIPVIIHLYNFRRYKKIYFTNVRFIAEIKQESRKRNQLKHLLILIARLLALSCLVFAFAQPYLPSPLLLQNTASKKAISVYIDNSFSMEALSQSGRLLDEAKNKAREIAFASRTSDLFQLLTNDFEGRHQRFVNRDEFINLIDEVKPSASNKPISEILKRQSDLFRGVANQSKISYLISDFQKSTSKLAYLKPDSLITCFFIPVQSGNINNLSIDSVWFENPSYQPDQPVRLNVKIKNSGTETFEKIPLRLMINKSPKTVSSFTVQAKDETIVQLVFTNNSSGIQQVMLEISDYPVTWDDKFFLSYTINPAITVLAINEEKENPYLQALFGSDTAFIFQNEGIKQLDYSAFRRHQLIILNNVSEFSSGLVTELSNYLNNGGTIVLFPPDRIELSQYNELLTKLELPVFSRVDTTQLRVTSVNTESRLFRNVFERDQSGKAIIPENPDFPMVFRHFVTSVKTKSDAEILMTLQNGDPFLTMVKNGKGKVFLFSSSLTETCGNFPKNPLFVPALFNIALQSQRSAPLYYPIPALEGVEVTQDSLRNREVFKIRNADSGIEIIPETRSSGQVILLYPHLQIQEAGNYTIFQDGKMIQGISFNYNRLESDLSFYSPGELEDMLKKNGITQFALIKGNDVPISKQISQLTQGVQLWKYFIIGALLFLLLEILIYRLIKD